jgi:hypothetical protein
MTKITLKEYNKALLICQQYRAQIDTEIGRTPLRSFIEYNKHRMSKRLVNTLNKATAKFEAVEDLTEGKLLTVRGCGQLTLQEFNNLMLETL